LDHLMRLQLSHHSMAMRLLEVLGSRAFWWDDLHCHPKTGPWREVIGESLEPRAMGESRSQEARAMPKQALEVGVLV